MAAACLPPRFAQLALPMELGARSILSAACCHARVDHTGWPRPECTPIPPKLLCNQRGYPSQHDRVSFVLLYVQPPCGPEEGQNGSDARARSSRTLGSAIARSVVNLDLP